MLHSHNGASVLGNGFRRLLTKSMTPFSGTTSPLKDAMRPLLAQLRKSPSSNTPTSSVPGQRCWTSNHGIVFASGMSTCSRTWCPTRGIVFDGDATSVLSLATPASIRASSTISTVGLEQQLPLSSETENSYVLANSYGNLQRLPLSTAVNMKPEDPTWVTQSSSNICVAEKPSLSILQASGDGVSGGAGTEDAGTTGSANRDTDSGLIDTEVQKHSTTRHPHQISSVEYHIPDEVFEAARNPTLDSPEGYWSHKLYVGPKDQLPKVHYCKSRHTTERVLQTYFMDEKLLGFDIEWKPEATKSSGIKNNVALIQIASESRIALFHLALFQGETITDLVAPTLKKIMEDPEVTKLGVAIKGDCTRLRNHLEIDARGIFELSHLYKLVKYSSTGQTSLINKKLVNLASQVYEHLGLPLYKGDEVRGSDWSKPLDMDQVAYAASDSYAGYMLFVTLESKRKMLVPEPPCPFHAELNIPIRLACGTEISTVDEAIIEDDVSTTAQKALTRRRPTTKVASTDIVVEPEADEKSTAFINAEKWAAEYRQEKPNVSASMVQLRAYALWKNEAMDVEQLPGELNIKESTAVSYVLEAVRQENLEFDSKRLRQVLDKVPEVMKSQWRIKTVMKMYNMKR